MTAKESKESKEVIEDRRKKRLKRTAEIFTPPTLVNQMLNKLPKEVWEEGKTFCDPACGNGNMLIHVLYRKIAFYGHDPLEALQSIYGADIMRDNIQECRMRLLKAVSLFCELIEEDVAAVMRNVVWLNHKTYPNGSLDYDFSFRNKAKQKDIDRWMGWIRDGVLNSVTLPIDAEPETGPMRDLFPDEVGDDEGYED